MNETLKTILTRRSIRKYEQEQIKEEEMYAILEAGKFAPSAMNQQSWHITVIQNKETIQKINEACIAFLIKSGNKNFQERSKGASVDNISIFYNAPTLIVVSGDEKAIAPQIDCSLSIGNMFLAAESLGISSCWIHALNHFYATNDGKAFLMKELIIPEGYSIVGSGVFGYKAVESPSPAPRKDGTFTIIK